MLFVAFSLVVGCTRPDTPAEDGENGAAEGGAANGNGAHAHDHADSDVLRWHRQDLEHEGYQISLGQHGLHPHAGEEFEPAVMVTKEGEPVADATVYVALLDAAGQQTLSEQRKMTYEPETADEPAHYAQAMVEVPADAAEVTLRYRIEIPGASEFTQDVPVMAEKY